MTGFDLFILVIGYTVFFTALGYALICVCALALYTFVKYVYPETFKEKK